MRLLFLIKTVLSLSNREHISINDAMRKDIYHNVTKARHARSASTPERILKFICQSEAV